MNKYIKQLIAQIIKLSEDRGLFAIYFTMATVALITAIYILFTLRPSDLQLVSHYTAFGSTHLYRANWIDQYKTILISIAILVFHILIARVVADKISRSLAKVIAWAGVIILIFNLINSILILNVWSPK